MLGARERRDALAGLSFEVDEARSWFARAKRSFDVIQMSLIDTWAATGAGAGARRAIG